MNAFMRHYHNAKICVAQIKRGEWTPSWNPLSRSYITAERSGRELWLANGPWFCDIDNKNYFGLLWRWRVWWASRRLAHAPVPAGAITAPVLEDDKL